MPETVRLSAPVTFADFWTGLSRQIAALDLEALRPEYAAFAAHRGIDPKTPKLWEDFTRLWVLFEATRDGGWWRLRWSVTNQEPSSVRIWKRWMAAPPDLVFDRASAVAECDEITALFALLAKRIGVGGVGLFYPTWNHTIAGWAPASLPKSARTPIVLIPTTQIFLGCEHGFDQTAFVTHMKSIQQYPMYDVRDTTEMPESLATFLLGQIQAYGEASPALWTLIRARRASILGSSMGTCNEYRRALGERARAQLTCADHRALRRLAETELERPQMTDEKLLAWLSAPAVVRAEGR